MPGSDLNELRPAGTGPGHGASQLLGQAGFRHAFFTRGGGVSEGPFSSLSFSTAVGDAPEHVDENLRRAATLLGVEASQVHYLSQVHGRAAHFYPAGDTLTRAELLTLEGDALGGSDPRRAYGVRSADCVPILIADVETGAVMAIHAGWRGVVAGVVEAGVDCLRQNIGGAGRLLAAIGPHISAAAFEVSEEVAAELDAVCPVRGAVSRPRAASGSTKPHVDLRFIVTQKLLAHGLIEAGIDQVGGCTYRDSEHYFSFRRDGKRSGRHLSAIVPRVG
jgi:YfiH family protein